MVIGITGGIGSGKSTVTRELARRGYSVYDCDREAKCIIAEDREVQSAIIALLGENAFAGGVYNTAYVSRRVFVEPTLLVQLNAIVHPAVILDIQRIVKANGSSGILFVESAILFEAGIDQLCDRIVVVEAPEDIRIARTIERDYHGEATKDNINKVRARMDAQQVNLPSSHNAYITATNDGKTSLVEIVDTIVSKLFTKPAAN